MGDEDLEVVVKHRTPICPAWTLYANMCDWGDRFGIAPAVIDQFKREMDQAVKVMRRAYEAGVRLMCGTDSGFAVTPYGHWHARELELLVDYVGLTPLEAIRAATSAAAHTLNLAGDIRVLQERARLALVLKGGKPVDTSGPWPERRIWPYEKAMTISTGGLMSRDRVLG